MKIASRLVAWQRKHGRHGLPWQNTRDPYRVWLSEIMLQQTQVTAVLDYYQRFLSKFPTVKALAEAPADQVMVEQTLSFKGNYFVLMGRISPLDGMGPNEIHFDRLLARIESPDTGVPIREVVLATNFTSEGEATAHYIGEVLKIKGIKVTRIARGIPVGGELEYVDAGTLARALMDRR